MRIREADQSNSKARCLRNEFLCPSPALRRDQVYKVRETTVCQGLVQSRKQVILACLNLECVEIERSYWIESATKDMHEG